METATINNPSLPAGGNATRTQSQAPRPETATTATKRCPKCGRTLPLSAFYRDRCKPDGHASQCKTCKNATNTSYKAAHPRKSPRKRIRGVVSLVTVKTESLLAELRRRGKVAEQHTAPMPPTDEQLMAELKARGWSGTLEKVCRAAV